MTPTLFLNNQLGYFYVGVYTHAHSSTNQKNTRMISGQMSKATDHGSVDLSLLTSVDMTNSRWAGVMVVCACCSAVRRGVLTTVLLVRVVLAVVVAVTQPGAADAFAVIAVEVHRRAGREHCRRGEPTAGQQGQTNKPINYRSERRKVVCSISI